ncbi:MAG: zinc ribbon domain-containing protein, partial [Deltaproteobacteria bacterium]|nr:zinc ribbon domain-containing protein [Deltaproteobacteria bacterium]
MKAMQVTATPPRILALYDQFFWDYLKLTGRLYLQCCSDCGVWRYPPGPACPACLSSKYEWKPVGGEGEILSWVIFHKEYLPQYPAPYNVIAVRLDEGPTIIS